MLKDVKPPNATEQALRETQAKFQRLVDNIGDKFVIFSHTGINGVVTYVSEGFKSVFGLNQEEIINKPWSESINWLPEGLEIAQAAVMETLKNAVDFQQFEMGFIHPNGDQRTVRVSQHPVRDEAGNVIAIEGILEHISDRKRAEEQLRQSEAKLAMAQQIAHVGHWEIDLKTKKTIWSTELLRMFGFELNTSAPSYRQAFRRLHPEDHDLWRRLWRRLLTTGIPYEVDLRVLLPNGEMRYIEARGESVQDSQAKVVRVLGTGLDITERKLAEAALQEHEKQYRNLVQAANCIILRWDVQGNIVFLNQYGSEFFCWPETEVMGKSVIGTIVPEWDSSGRDLQALMAQICQQPDSFLISENENMRQNGERVWINWANKPIFNEAGECVEILSIGTDITARKRSEEALAQKNIDLEAAKQAAEKANRVKSQFLANMTHELRTPLNAILGFAQVMQRSLKHDPERFQQEAAEHLQIIQNSGNHLLSLINDVLDMSKIEAAQMVLNPHPCDLDHLLRSLCAMFELKARDKGLTLAFELASDIPQYIETDEAKLRQILINLLGNAIKCTQTGSVTLRVWSQHNLYFEVKDTGCGIAADQLEKLFDVFYQAESDPKSQEGTGLGLTITKHYVELFGGEITVESSLGEGSVFQFYIPVTPVENINRGQGESSLSVVRLAPNQPTYRILVTEDKWESRTLLVKLLKSVGFEAVREAKNGLEAVEIFESWQPHLIWMDMRMPVMDGYEATQQIRTHLKGQAPAIIALTASALEQDKQIILSAGCNDFVYKPFQQKVIFEKLQQYLGVEYIYEEQSAANATQPGDPQSLTPERLSQTPQEWLLQLHEAASLADAEWVTQLIHELPPSDADLASALTHLLKDFRCDLIEELAELTISLNLQ